MLVWGEDRRKILELVNKKISEVPILEFIGYRLVDIGDGYAKAAFEHNRKIERTGGIVQGGVIMTALDATMGLAAAAAKGKDNVTLELKVNFMEPLDGGLYEVYGRVLRVGRHTIVAEGELKKGGSILAAKALGTYFVLE